jgi:hypothetical protein
MKSTSAGIWLVLASLTIISLPPCLAQDASSTPAAAPAAATDAGTATTTTTTKKHHFRKQRAKKAKKVKYHKPRMSKHNLSGGVSKKGKHKKYTSPSSGQQKRTDRLNAALSNPKHYPRRRQLYSIGSWPVKSTNICAGGSRCA